MTKALLIIDYTNDFVATNGALTVGTPAQILEPKINQLAQEFLINNDYIILPTDLHNANNPFETEAKLFPPHNLLNTWGRQYFGKLNDWVQAQKNNEHVYAYPKNHYNSFANTNLDNFLRERHITDLHLVGVCTDICVLHTAVAAYDLNYTVTIHSDAVATFTPNGQEWALNHFTNSLGFKVI
ncbi:cysteine hydrolase family protein [Periweissella fabalis]|uniref:Cysteine hydrolase n=1 Tax=Periweissella fabalis TaxID=1070421 RepID=A0A7X6S3C8_9LACO|nr:isochorismatase family cysteine hydrolase [Periweissella fabalis]MCM0599726.1 cysteine hydrolase [Periweissella fabalis]NKZ24468.1 cysteine hydrolase [Periweissella fabalis]